MPAARVKFGVDSWNVANLINFYDIVNTRKDEWKKAPLHWINLEMIIYKNNWDRLLDCLEQHFLLDIDRASSKDLLDHWLSLHWPTEKTFEWEFSNIFPQNRMQKELDILEKFNEN